MTLVEKLASATAFLRQQYPVANLKPVCDNVEMGHYCNRLVTA